MKTENIRLFKKKINNGFVLGPFSKTSDPAFIEIMGYSGFDFVIIDLEHAPNSVQTIQNIIRAAENSNVLPIVRVKENNPDIIGEVLDIGAAGIQVPQITNKKDAELVIKHAKFAPEGMRGVCRFVRAANYSSMDRHRYFKEANEALIILQLEGEEAISNLDEILSVDGIDIIFIGPYDLSQSLGVSGQVEHPLVIKKMIEITDICKAKGITVGTFVDTIENAKKWSRYGIKYISYSVDMGIFTESSRNIVDDIKST